MGAAAAIRLASLIQGLEVGGMETMAVELVNHLPSRYEVVVCCYDGLGPLADELAAAVAVEHIPRRRGFDWRLIRRLRCFLREHRIDVLHMHNHTAMVYGTIAARLAGTRRTVYTEHGRFERLSVAARLLHRLLCRYIDQTVVVSDRLTDVLADEGFSPSAIRTIPNGVVDSLRRRQDPGRLAELGLQPTDHIIGIVARLHAVKNHSLLLRAMQLVIAADPVARLVIVGDGAERQRLEEQTRELGLAGVVRFLGERRDVPELMSLFDLYVLSSHSEGMSLTLLEAMAAGLPCVVTDVGGNSELVEAEVNGLLAPSNDAPALAAAILRVLDSPELAARMGSSSRDKFLADHSIETMVERYVSIFEA